MVLTSIYEQTLQFAIYSEQERHWTGVVYVVFVYPLGQSIRHWDYMNE